MEIEIAVPTPLYQTFIYDWDDRLEPGVRALVPFGKQKLVGVVLNSNECNSNETVRDYELKRIDQIIDDHPVYSTSILKIARWMSDYYLYPLGEVLKAMLPASSAKTIAKKYLLNRELWQSLDANSLESKFLSMLFLKRDSLGEKSFQNKFNKLISEHKEYAGITLNHLKKIGFIADVRQTIHKPRTRSHFHSEPPGGEPASGISAKPQNDGFDPDQRCHMNSITFTEAQERAFKKIAYEGLPSTCSKPFLLWGVTGSGKTEIYLQLIEKVLTEYQAQALVLVPEISLTPQMTRIFERRFPDNVVVVHSAMPDHLRWQKFDAIRTGQVSILIGPRSAVFGPFKNLKLIIVDEEHDSSYKQVTGLTYNGRDIAILRAKLENACVVLGSATPSLESFHNANIGKYQLIHLPERVSGAQLPKVEIVCAKPAFKTGQLIDLKSAVFPAMDIIQLPIDEKIIQALDNNYQQGFQSIVLVNRRGYAYYLWSPKTKRSICCPQCSISLTLHALSRLLKCHYCDYQTTLIAVLKKYPDQSFVAVGYGSEKTHEFLKQQIPGAKVERLDSDVLSQDRDLLPKVLEGFRNKQIDILVGTQILAKGHDYPHVTLTVILEADQFLNLPDFRAGERTFQLIVQAAGRAGRAEYPGKVMIQALRPDHPIIVSALSQNYQQFAENELRLRKRYQYPPFWRLVMVEINSISREKLDEFSERMHGWVEQYLKHYPEMGQKLKILGPAPAPIEVIRYRFRKTILFCSQYPSELHKMLNQFLTVFKKAPGDIRVKVDVDPQSII